MKKQVVVMGLGRFGFSVAATLQSLGHDVLALDDDEKNVAAAASLITRAVQADSTNESVLREMGVPGCDVAIVSMGVSIEASVLSTILAKKLGVRRVIARANNDLHGSILEKIGADAVVYPERDMGIRTAHGMNIPTALDYMPVGSNYGMAKVRVPPFLAGKKLADLGFGPRGRWEIAVLILQRKNEVTISPDLAETVKPDDLLIIAGEDDKLERLLQEAMARKSAGG